MARADDALCDAAAVRASLLIIATGRVVLAGEVIRRARAIQAAVVASLTRGHDAGAPLVRRLARISTPLEAVIQAACLLIHIGAAHFVGHTHPRLFGRRSIAMAAQHTVNGVFSASAGGKTKQGQRNGEFKFKRQDDSHMSYTTTK